MIFFAHCPQRVVDFVTHVDKIRKTIHGCSASYHPWWKRNNKKCALIYGRTWSVSCCAAFSGNLTVFFWRHSTRCDFCWSQVRWMREKRWKEGIVGKEEEICCHGNKKQAGIEWKLWRRLLHLVKKKIQKTTNKSHKNTGSTTAVITTESRLHFFSLCILICPSPSLDPPLAAVWLSHGYERSAPSWTELFAAGILSKRTRVSERSGSGEDMGVCSQAGSVWFHTSQLISL